MRRRPRAGRDDAVLEGQRLLAAVDQLDVERARVAERRHALQVLTLRSFRTWPAPAVSWPTTLFLKSRSLSRSIFGFCERDAEVGGVRRLGDHVGDVQQRLRRNAAAIEADAAGVLLRIDERDLHAAVGGVERRRVPAGTGADDDQLSGIDMSSRDYGDQEVRDS